MAHFVVTRQQFRQYIIYGVAGLLISFVFGYWVGTESVVQRGVSALLPPKIEAARTEEIDSLAAAPAAGKLADAAEEKIIEPARPLPAPLAAKPVLTPAPAAPKPVVTAAPAAPVAAKPVVTATATEPVKPVPPPAVAKPASPPPPKPVTPVAVTAAKPATAVATTPEPVKEAAPATVAAETAPATVANFAVQVGVFSSQENAMKLVDELNAKGFDAYLDEFESETGETKFNVRFGRGSDREQVQRKLTRYRQLYASSAYIITLK